MSQDAAQAITNDNGALMPLDFGSWHKAQNLFACHESVMREWSMAKAWLYNSLSNEGE